MYMYMCSAIIDLQYTCTCITLFQSFKSTTDVHIHLPLYSISEPVIWLWGNIALNPTAWCMQNVIPWVAQPRRNERSGEEQERGPWSMGAGMTSPIQGGEAERERERELSSSYRSPRDNQPMRLHRSQAHWLMQRQAKLRSKDHSMPHFFLSLSSLFSVEGMEETKLQWNELGLSPRSKIVYFSYNNTVHESDASSLRLLFFNTCWSRKGVTFSYLHNSFYLRLCTGRKTKIEFQAGKNWLYLKNNLEPVQLHCTDIPLIFTMTTTFIL